MVLKLTLEDEETIDEARALAVWDGNGAVRLFRSVPGAMLLERLDGERSLNDLPIAAATSVAAKLPLQLSVPTSQDFMEMESYSQRSLNMAQERLKTLGQPFPEEWLTAPPRPRSSRLVNSDLHYENVLAGQRQDWLVVDPKPLLGDPEYAVAPLLWNRAEENDSRDRFEQIVREADLDRARALDWTLFRLLDYWLWALELGFTEDPPRCRRLVERLRASG